MSWRPILRLFAVLMVVTSTSAVTQRFQHDNEFDAATQNIVRGSTEDRPSRRQQLGGASTLHERQPRPRLKVESNDDVGGAREPAGDVDPVARGNGGRQVPVGGETLPWQPVVDGGGAATSRVKYAGDDDDDDIQLMVQTNNDDDDDDDVPAVDAPAPLPQPPHSRPSRPGFNPTGW